MGFIIFPPLVNAAYVAVTVVGGGVTVEIMVAVVNLIGEVFVAAIVDGVVDVGATVEVGVLLVCSIRV